MRLTIVVQDHLIAVLLDYDLQDSTGEIAIQMRT